MTTKTATVKPTKTLKGPLKPGLKLTTSTSKAFKSVTKKFTKGTTKSTPIMVAPTVPTKKVDPKIAADTEAALKAAKAKGRAAMEKALLKTPKKKPKEPTTKSTLVPFPNDVDMRLKLIQEFSPEEFEYFESTVYLGDFSAKPYIIRKVDEIELDKNDKFMGEVPCPREFERTKVTDKLGNEYYILMVGAGETAICADDKVFMQTATDIPATRSKPTPSFTIYTVKRPTKSELIVVGVKQLAADMAMQTLEPKKVAKGWTEEPLFVRVAVITKENKDAGQICDDLVRDIKAFENDRKSKGPKTITDPTKDLYWLKLPATCHCNKPDVFTSKPANIKCTDCVTIAHTECINNATKYTCAPCKIKIDGVNWGQGHAPNSCPVDNTITHFALRASKDPKFLKAMEFLSKHEKKSPPVLAFAQSVLHAVNNDSGKSHQAWKEVLENGPPPGADAKAKDGFNHDGTWFGGTDDRLYAYINKEMCQFVKKLQGPCKGECSIVDTPKNNPEFIHTPEAYISLTTRPVDYFNTKSSVNASEERPCDNVGVDACCKGVLTYDKISIPDKKYPLYLVVRNQGALNGPEDFFDMPKRIAITGIVYQLGMLNMFDRYNNHFTSLHYVDKQFVYYDGAMTSKRKFKRALPSHYKQVNIYLDHVLYVRVLGNEI